MGNVLGFAHTFYRHLIKELCADNTNNSGLRQNHILLVLAPLLPALGPSCGQNLSYASTAHQQVDHVVWVCNRPWMAKEVVTNEAVFSLPLLRRRLP
jgi:hypothetical protein